MAAVQRAEGLLASAGGREELWRRVRRWRNDLELAARLDEIRLEQAAAREGHSHAAGFDLDLVFGEEAYR
jgi:hypothetical protein